MLFVILLSFCGTTLGCMSSANEEREEDYLDYGWNESSDSGVVIGTSEQSMCHN